MNPYTIQTGDTLSQIALNNNTSVTKLMNMNPSITDPNKIYAGSSLNLGLAGGPNATTNVVPPTSGATPLSAPANPADISKLSPAMQEYFKANPNALNLNTKGPNNTPYIQGSESVVNNENSIIDQINGKMANDPFTASLQQSKADTDKIISDEQARLTAQLAAQNAQLNAQFDNAIANAKDAQQKELATNVVTLARIGGYLGGSASAVGQINNLQAKQKLEISNLEGQRRDALQIAANAINDKQYKLAMDKLQNVKDFEKAINDRNQQFFDQYLKLSEEARSQSKYVTEKADDILQKYVDSGKDMSMDEMGILSKTLGTSPEVIQGLIQAKRDAVALDKQEKKTDMEIKILNVLKDIPAGKYVKIGDKTYGGLKVATPTGVANPAAGAFDLARKFVADNKGKLNYDQLNVELRKQFPKLTDGDIASVLSEATVQKNPIILNDTTAKVAATKAIAKAEEILGNSDTATVNGLIDAMTDLDAEQKAKIKAQVEEMNKPFSDKVHDAIFGAPAK